MTRFPNHSPTVKGFTLIELSVVITVIAVLATLLMPAIALVRESSKRVVCLSYLRQFGIASIAWSKDHKSLLPPVMYGDPSWDNHSHVHGVRPTVYDEIRQYGFESSAHIMCPLVREHFKRFPSWTETSYSYNFLLGGRDVWYPSDGSGIDRQHGLNTSLLERPGELILFSDNYGYLNFNTVNWGQMLVFEFVDGNSGGVGDYWKAHPVHMRKMAGTRASGYDNYVTLDGRGGSAYVTEETNGSAPALRRPRWTDTRVVP